MKNYKLLIINGSGALWAIFTKRLRRENKALWEFPSSFIIHHYIFLYPGDNKCLCH